MFRTILWYLNFGISLALKIPQLFIANRLEKKGLLDEKNAYTHKVTSKWAMNQIKMSGATVQVTGHENVPKDIPVVFISNHQGNFDIPLLMSFIEKPKGFIAKIETKKIPVVNSWMKHLNCVFMDRSTLRDSAAAIIEGINLIKQGHSLIIFPEGTRSKQNALGEFKSGSFKLATKPKVPIVPVTINGSYKLMEQNGNRIKPATINITIHPPITTAALTKEELNELPNRVKNIIASKLG